MKCDEQIFCLIFLGFRIPVLLDEESREANMNVDTPAASSTSTTPATAATTTSTASEDKVATPARPKPPGRNVHLPAHFLRSLS